MSRTVLVGLDGATFSVLDWLMDDSVMPCLSQICRSGVRRDLMSTPNPLTPPAWTSVMTGRSPGAHGIFDFVRVLTSADRPRYSLATSREVRVETIWSILSRSGRTVTTLNFPLMFPPRPVNGHVVPGFLPPRHLRRFVYPPDLYDDLRRLPGFDPAELLLNLDIERESLQTLPPEQYEAWLELHIRREAQWAAVALWLMEHRPSDLTAVLFDGVDKLQHLCWRHLDPATRDQLGSPLDRRVHELCREYFRQLDGHIANIVQRAGPDAHVALVSDHGFGPTDSIFYANALLAEHGFLRFAPAVQSDEVGKQMTEGHRSPVALFDWDHTVAYALTAGSNGIYLRQRQEPGEPGVSADEYDATCDRIEALLRSVRCPWNGAPVVRDVMRRSRAFPGACSSLAPDLTLVLEDYGFISVLKSDEVVRRRAVVAGTHRPNGISIVAGPGIRQGVVLGPHAIYDVAPLLLYLQGLPIPEDLEGQLPLEIFEPSTLRAKPPRVGPATELPEPFFDETRPVLDGAGEAMLMSRLKALGYVE